MSNTRGGPFSTSTLSMALMGFSFPIDDHFSISGYSADKINV